jgi:ribosomal protein S18 acetylase RimI-like enzyme
MNVPQNLAAREITAADVPAIERALRRILPDAVDEATVAQLAAKAFSGRVMGVFRGGEPLALMPFYLPPDGAGQAGAPFVRPGEVGKAALVRLAARAVLDLGAQTVHVALEPADKAARLFLDAGFVEGPLMLEMSAPVPAGAPGTGGRWTTYETGRRAAFAEVFRRTLEGSADCVELPPSGDSDACMRAFDQRGEHAPEDFALLEGDAGPSGILLVVAVSGNAEIAYLGVVPEARGRGLAKLLVARAFERAAARGARVLTVAVDSRNAAALALYRAGGFSENRAVRVYYARRSFF